MTTHDPLVDASRANVAAVRAARAATVAACGALPTAHLIPGDRQLLGARLLPCGPVLCDLVSAALRRYPERYSDLPIDGDALAARQAEADAWLALRSALLGLAQRASDQYLAAQADANHTAVRTLEHVFSETIMPGDRELERKRLRRYGLIEPYRLLSAAQGKKPPARRRASPQFGRARAAARLFRDFEAARLEASTAPAPEAPPRPGAPAASTANAPDPLPSAPAASAQAPAPYAVPGAPPTPAVPSSAHSALPQVPGAPPTPAVPCSADPALAPAPGAESTAPAPPPLVPQPWAAPAPTRARSSPWLLRYLPILDKVLAQGSGPAPQPARPRPGQRRGAVSSSAGSLSPRPRRKRR